MPTLDPAIADAATASPSVLLSASKDPSHPHHHFAFGQVLATMMLGAEEAFLAYQQPASIPAAINAFITGFTSIWLKPPTAPSDASVASPSNQ